MDIPVKEFIAKVGTLLRKASLGEEIVITFHSKPYVKLISAKAKVITIEKKSVNNPDKVITLTDVATMKNKVAEYGCGCERVSGKVICEKHKRL
ncbi:MAG: type II toxin-antitoxin system prevent-host-death family antitoxin [Candidatus Omnitrophota bacterium]|nr:type II toxin-antitoxin system prevent-host-death family antitoxin [Candidatus Omnitrophota bacterium]